VPVGALAAAPGRGPLRVGQARVGRDELAAVSLRRGRQTVVGRGPGEAQQRGRRDGVLQQPLQLVRGPPPGRVPAARGGQRRAAAVEPGQLLQDRRVEVLAVALAEPLDPLHPDLRRAQPLPPSPVLQVLAHVLPQADDECQPPRPRVGGQHPGEVAGQRGRRAARERVGAGRGAQLEHALQLLRPEQVGPGRGQLQRRPPLLGDRGGRGRADPLGRREPEQRHQDGEPVAQPVRVGRAEEPQGREHRVAPVAGGAGQPRRGETGAQPDTRARGHLGPAGHQRGELRERLPHRVRFGPGRPDGDRRAGRVRPGPAVDRQHRAARDRRPAARPRAGRHPERQPNGHPLMIPTRATRLVARQVTRPLR
jgi:hypothetical protein